MTYERFREFARDFWLTTAKGELPALLAAWHRQTPEVKEAFIAYVVAQRKALQLHHLQVERLLDHASAEDLEAALQVLAMDPFFEISGTRRSILLPAIRAGVSEAELRQAVGLPPAEPG